LSNSNPSREFMDCCIPIMNQWEAGTVSFEDTVQQFGVLRQEAIEARHYANQAQIEIMIGVMHGLRAELDTAIQQFRAARMLFEQAGNKERVLLCDTNIAEIYQQKGNLVRSRQTYKTAYLEAKRISSVRIQAICLGNMGHIAVLQGAFDQARPALEEAEQLLQESHDRARTLGLLCDIYRDMVGVYLSQGEPQLAWRAGRKQLQVAQENQELVNLGRANRAIGELLTTMQNPPEAVEAGFSTDPDVYFQSAIGNFRDMKADLDLAQTLSAHGESLAKRGQTVSGARKVQQAARIFERLGLMSEAAKATELQGKILTGKFQN
jgi:tetratricopeptide (TPR) repeat protein